MPLEDGFCGGFSKGAICILEWGKVERFDMVVVNGQ